MSSTNLMPSYYGYIGSTRDAIIIIQAILDDRLKLIPRRPHERERPSLIKSGNVFVFIEENSGIKRWTDGIAWSPSRILGRFLVYRELDKNSSHEKEEKKKRRRRKYSIQQDPVDPSSPFPQFSTQNEIGSSQDNSNPPNSFVVKDRGLIKKTLSVTTNTKELNINKTEGRQTIHLISYYNADDLLNARLHRPSEHDFKHVKISSQLWNAAMESSLGGKIPIEDEANYFLDTNYQLQNITSLQKNKIRSHSDNTYYYSHPTVVPTQNQGPRLSHHVASYPNLLNTQYIREKSNDHIANTQPGTIHPISFEERNNNMYPKYKIEDEFNREIAPSGELTFVNPFRGTTQNTISYATASRYNTLSQPQQPQPQQQYQQQQYQQQQGQQQLQLQSQPQVQHLHPHHFTGIQQSLNQYDGNIYSSQQLYLPFHPHIQQTLQHRDNINSISDSSDFSITANSNGSMSSASSNILVGSVSNSFSGTPTPNYKKGYRTTSNSGNWFTSTNGPYATHTNQLSDLNNTSIEGTLDNVHYNQKTHNQNHLNDDSTNFQSYGESYASAAPQAN